MSLYNFYTNYTYKQYQNDIYSETKRVIKYTNSIQDLFNFGNFKLIRARTMQKLH